MKAKIIRGTTLKGAAVHEGEIVEVDSTDFHLLKMQKQAIEATPEEIQAANESKAKKGK